MVINGGVVVALIGSLCAITAMLGTKLIQTQIYGIEQLDAVSFVAAVDPMTAMRAD